MKTPLSLVSAAALALAACGAPDEAVEDRALQDMAVAPGIADGSDPSTPQGFIDLAASSDMYEIEAGRLAQEMGRSSKVDDAGAMLVEDHTATSDRLRAAVVEGGAGLSFPEAMLPGHEHNLDALRTAGDDFDRLFSRQQFAAHQQTLALLQREAKFGTVASLRAFAAETAPIVESHLEHFRDLAEASGGL